ncbi:MAG: ferrous iron transport protein A [Clostridiales bacterium]|jgi:Fe2+ transport system protein FeoA|nr:ferrous iron transport protein A [Clostridiales bacterium]
MTLMDVREGTAARVVGVKDGASKRRLLDFGFTPGTIVTVNNAAPFGGTVSVGLRGYTVAVRATAARAVEVIPCM